MLLLVLSGIKMYSCQPPQHKLTPSCRGLNVSAACYQGGTLVISDVDEQGTQSRILVVTKDLSRPTEAGLGSQQAIPELRETVAALDKGTTNVRGERKTAGGCPAVICDDVQRRADCAGLAGAQSLASMPSPVCKRQRLHFVRVERRLGHIRGLL